MCVNGILASARLIYSLCLHQRIYGASFPDLEIKRLQIRKTSAGCLMCHTEFSPSHLTGGGGEKHIF